MMSRCHRLGAVAVSAAIALSTFAQEKTGLERTATSSIKTSVNADGDLVTETINRRFTFTTFYTENGFSSEQLRTLLLLEEFKSTRRIFADQIQGTVRVDAWIGRDAKPENKLWAIEQSGDTGVLADRFYQVTKYGCCASLATDVYFSLLSGQKLYTTNTGLFRIIVPNTSVALVRYVAFHAPDAILPPDEPQSANNQAGVIQYGSEKSVLQRIVLRCKCDLGLPRMQMLYQGQITKPDELMLWGADKKNNKSSLSDFSVVLSFDDVRKVIIPVKNDQLVISAATVPKGFNLGAAK